MRIAIVTDSTSDLPKYLIKEMPIFINPAILVIDRHSYEDGKGISRQRFYELLPNMEPPPTTAAPSVGSFELLYEKLIRDGYEYVLSIHASAQLSGIVNSAYTAADKYKKSVQVIDSEQLSLGLGFQVLEAAQLAKFRYPLDLILNRVANLRNRIQVIAMLDTLDFVQRSGRVSWAKALLGSMLKIKLFVELKNGAVHNIGQVRTHRKGFAHLLKLISELGPVERLAILHTNAEIEAQNLLHNLGKEISNSNLVVNVTTVIGTHVGPGGLGFAAVVK
jgi:DegV family protein with EDD domain